jgi:hypothetical protein
MRVTIRLRQGRKLKRKLRKNQHVALAFAALLTPGALMACVLGLWRLGSDLGAAGQFAIASGFFSHWQVWLGASAILQIVATLLNRYGRPEPDLPKSEDADVATLLKYES